jgi:N-acetylglucosaminyldiphosphoundecaprenol N-acetyl-beta-D-mannosaminyltransferase
MGQTYSNPKFRQILGLNFFHGSAAEAVDMMQRGGLLVVPAAPALRNLASEPEYRAALLSADLVITDSGLMVLLWNFLQRDSIRRLSGLKYMRELIQRPEFRRRGETFWIMASPLAAAQNLSWLRAQGVEVGEGDAYVAPVYGHRVEDRELLSRLRERHPKHVIVTLGGGTQERLGVYLKNNLDYAAAIHCTGAAIAFLSGDQVRVPVWADRLYLAWLLRCLADPRRYGPRYWEARNLVPIMIRYRERLPELESVPASRRAA